MSSKTYILCPGQGAQALGMGKDFYDKSPAAQETFDAGLKLVAARGKYMQEDAVATPSGMVAIMGGDEAGVTKLCEENAQGEVLVPANFNAPGQIVVSGSKAACERIVTAASAAGLKAVPLVVDGAFHSPILGAKLVFALARGLEKRAKTSFAPTGRESYHDRKTSRIRHRRIARDRRSHRQAPGQGRFPCRRRRAQHRQARARRRGDQER